jgi:hypothetical protein
MPESFKSRLTRIAFNFFPCYRRTGARVTYTSSDMHEVRIKLPLNWKCVATTVRFSEAACTPPSIRCT